MLFSVPYNGDLEFLQTLKKRGTFPIATVYGKMAQDVIGGGRPRCYMSGFSRENMIEAVKLTHELGAQFNYLFNAICSANVEFEEQRAILDATADLVENLGIDRITVANPFVLKLLKRHFPELSYSVSKIAEAGNLEKVKRYEELGADEITLAYSVHRNFRELENITGHSAVDFQVIVNNGCIFSCPFDCYHQQTLGHDTQSGYNESLRFFDICRYTVADRIARDSSELIKAPWIRPEDLQYYEAAGVHKFKLIGRLQTTPWLLRALEAYHRESYPGNLCDVVGFFDPMPEDEETPELHPEDIDWSDSQALKPYWLLKPYIDNEGLTELDFLSYFVNHRQPCGTVTCSDCRYCETVADRVVTLNEQNARMVINNVRVLKEKWLSDTLKDVDTP